VTVTDRPVTERVTTRTTTDGPSERTAAGRAAAPRVATDGLTDRAAVAGARQPERTVPDLLREMVDETRVILRDEVRLAKTETRETVSRIGSELAQVGIGAAVGIVALIALGTAVTFAMVSLFGQFLELEVAMWLGPLVLGLVLSAVAVVVAKRGIERLKRESLVPEKTMATLEEDKEWIRARTR
jgi:hypothetical protein